MDKIFFVDPRGNFNADDKDVLSRHLSYIASYRTKYFENLLIEVLGVSTLSRSDRLNVVRIMDRTRNVIFFALRTLPYLKNERKCVLVASDPWFSFLAAKCIVFLRKSNDKIQLQLHGQYVNSKHSRIRNLVIKRYIKFCIERSTETRFVNQIEYERFSESCFNTQDRMFYSPVPINPIFFKPSENPSSNRPLVLGFVGRLHQERGLSEFVRLACSLKKSFPSLRLLIVGDGNARAAFERQIITKFGTSYEFAGFLPPEELRKKMNQIGILASCAPSESYGRALREALLCGVPVLAIPSDGVTSLREGLPSECIQVFDFEQDTDDVIATKFKTLQKAHFSHSDILDKLGIEREPGSKLIESWNRLNEMNRCED